MIKRHQPSGPAGEHLGVARSSAEANAIPVEEILAAFDLPTTTDPATELRDLESDAFSVAALRAWLAERGAP